MQGLVNYRDHIWYLILKEFTIFLRSTCLSITLKLLLGPKRKKYVIVLRENKGVKNKDFWCVCYGVRCTLLSSTYWWSHFWDNLCIQKLLTCINQKNKQNTKQQQQQKLRQNRRLSHSKGWRGVQSILFAWNHKMLLSVRRNKYLSIYVTGEEI